jgi:hypothetical protein
VLLIVAMWPVVVCSFHCMAAFVLAFSEPFERQASGDWQSIATGGLRAMFSFAADRMLDFVKLCWVNRIDFWMKWKMMLRAVTSFLVFFAHAAIALVCTVLLASLKVPVFAILGATLPWFWISELAAAFAAHSKPVRAVLWTVTLPVMIPLSLALSGLCSAFFIGSYAIGSCFLVLMSVLGGGLYVADATFKKMSWRVTKLAIAYVICEFDKDTSEIMAHIVMVRGPCLFAWETPSLVLSRSMHTVQGPVQLRTQQGATTVSLHQLVAPINAVHRTCCA